MSTLQSLKNNTVGRFLTIAKLLVLLAANEISLESLVQGARLKKTQLEAKNAAINTEVADLKARIEKLEADAKGNKEEAEKIGDALVAVGDK